MFIVCFIKLAPSWTAYEDSVVDVSSTPSTIQSYVCLYDEIYTLRSGSPEVCILILSNTITIKYTLISVCFGGAQLKGV